MRHLSSGASGSGRYIEAQAEIFKALGHPSRLAMAQALMGESLCVGELQEVIGGSDISTVSRHLSILKAAGIVKSEKRGLNVYYSLNMTSLGQLLTAASAMLDKEAQKRQAQLAAMMTP